jgi:hypothetical protein
MDLLSQVLAIFEHQLYNQDREALSQLLNSNGDQSALKIG